MKRIRILRWSLWLGVLLLLRAGAAVAADTQVIRVAIGPFFAPAADALLQKAATDLPDLLAASLPQDGRFQLVERSQVNAIWSEVHLTQGGFIAADSVARLGHVLSCDWLVSGSFVTTESATQIWVKVINTQDSTVIDLQAIPYQPANVAATARNIAAFLAQARSRTQPPEFIALGKFNDWSVSTTRVDWAPRVAAFLEKQLLTAGYGVVEREAVAPIFAEYQFQAAGLTRDSTNRVKLKPAFWIVDGGCKWIRDTQDKLSVSVRVQKMGQGEQEYLFAKAPGDEMLADLWRSVQASLASGGSLTLAQAQAGEEKLRATNLAQLSLGHGPAAPLHLPADPTFITLTNADGSLRTLTVDPVYLALKKQRAEDMKQDLEEAILLNPKNMSAKFMLGRSLFGRPDATQNKQGADLLEEVAASGSEPYATRAKNWLADFRTGKITLERDRRGMLTVVLHGQPASFPPIDTNASQRQFAELKARTVNMFVANNLATRAATVAKIPANLPASAQYDGITAVKLYGRKIYLACGTTLHAFNLDANRDQEIHLPRQLTHAVTAIECDADSLWLGSDGGLLRLTLASGAIREFGEHDGFPTAAVSALQMAGSRLFMGFNGAFGYLDTGTEKFTGLMTGVKLTGDWLAATKNPPSTRVLGIESLDGNNFWVSSMSDVRHFDFAANTWSLAFPKEYIHEIGVLGASGYSVSPSYVVLKDYLHCVAVHPLPGTNWMTVNLVAGAQGFQSESVALDPGEASWLWIGGDAGKITLLDLTGCQVIAEGKVPGPGIGIVQWIVPVADKVVFLTGNNHSSTLSCLDKATLMGTKPMAAPVVPAVQAAPVAQAVQPAQIAQAVPANPGGGGDPLQQFLRANFGKFKPVQFQKDANGFAHLQRLKVPENQINSGGTYYCGFQFTVPPWLDGNFVLNFALAKTASSKDFMAKQFDEHVFSATGDEVEFESLDRNYIADCPLLHRELPYTITETAYTVAQNRLQPGKTYDLAIEYQEANLPGFVFTITIDSARGAAEYGQAPEFNIVNSAVTTPNPPASAEELRSRFEAALQAKDRAALIGLVCWQDVPDAEKERYIDESISTWLNLTIAQVKLQPEQNFTIDNPQGGNRPQLHANIQVQGDLQVMTDSWGDSSRLSYGKLGNGYLIIVNIAGSK